MVLCTVAPARVPAQDTEYSADKVKAAFLFNFGSFVEWPQGQSPDEALDIAVLGSPVVAEELRRIAGGRTIQGRRVRVHEIATVDEIGSARILFFGKPAGTRLERHAAKLRDRHVLIVTQEDEALRRGSMINFAILDRRVRFEVSLTAARAAGLELSSRLLGIALRVERNGQAFEESDTPRIAANCRQ